MRFASSATVSASGITTSRMTFSLSAAPPIAFLIAFSRARRIDASERTRDSSALESAWFIVSFPEERRSSPPFNLSLPAFSFSFTSSTIGVEKCGFSFTLGAAAGAIASFSLGFGASITADGVLVSGFLIGVTTPFLDGTTKRSLGTGRESALGATISSITSSTIGSGSGSGSIISSTSSIASSISGSAISSSASPLNIRWRAASSRRIAASSASFFICSSASFSALRRPWRSSAVRWRMESSTLPPPPRVLCLTSTIVPLVPPWVKVRVLRTSTATDLVRPWVNFCSTRPLSTVLVSCKRLGFATLRVSFLVSLASVMVLV